MYVIEIEADVPMKIASLQMGILTDNNTGDWVLRVKSHSRSKLLFGHVLHEDGLLYGGLWQLVSGSHHQQNRTLVAGNQASGNI